MPQVKIEQEARLLAPRVETPRLTQPPAAAPPRPPLPQPAPSCGRYGPGLPSPRRAHTPPFETLKVLFVFPSSLFRR